jgi:hypothetical protein
VTFTKPFLKGDKEGEERFRLWNRLLFLFELLQEGLRELWLPVLQQTEFPQHLRGGRVFSVSLCLKLARQRRAKRVVKPLVTAVVAGDR